MIDESKVFEMHGVWAPSSTNGTSSGWVDVREVSGNRVSVSTGASNRDLEPDAALRLANQIRRVAQRIKARQP